MKILLIGSRGNLGEQIMDSLLQAGHQVLPTTQSTELKQVSIHISPWSPFGTQNLDNIDYIVNAANLYWHSTNIHQIKEMEDSIVGVAETISKSLEFTNAKIVNFSTYFQYAPADLRPWSEYSSLKSRAVQVLENSCGQHGNSLINIILRDNFGGARRDKFLDVAISANKSQEILSASPGQSILNLVHVKDIAEALTRCISEENPQIEIQNTSFEISCRKSYTLKELVEYIDSLSDKRTNVAWGALPYREREVFKDWKCADLFPYFREARTLEDYIKKRLSET